MLLHRRRTLEGPSLCSRVRYLKQSYRTQTEVEEKIPLVAQLVQVEKKRGTPNGLIYVSLGRTKHFGTVQGNVKRCYLVTHAILGPDDWVEPEAREGRRVPFSLRNVDD